MTNSVSDSEIALFRNFGVNRRNLLVRRTTVRLRAMPPISLNLRKIANFWIGNITVLKIEKAEMKSFKRILLYACRPSCPVAQADGTGVNGKHKKHQLFANSVSLWCE